MTRETKKMLSLPLVLSDDWLFKISQMDKEIMVVAFSPIFNWSHVKFFRRDSEVRNWTEYLRMQTKSLIEDVKAEADGEE